MPIKENRKVYKNIFWYLFGTICPMGINFIKTPIFTRYFTPEEYGKLSLITITFGYMSIIIYSWIANCIWRFYIKYKNHNKLNLLFSNIIFIYIVSSFIVTIISFTWMSFIEDSSIKILVFLSFIQIILTQFLGLYMIITKLEGKAAKYSAIKILVTLGGFTILLFLAFRLNCRIEAIIESNIIINTILIIIILFKYIKHINLTFKLISFKEIKKFIGYGFPSSICSISLLVLTSSDRYIIKLFYPFKYVGVYDQIYNLAQISIAAFVDVFFNAVDPILYRELENNINDYDKTMTKYMNMYFVLMLPLTVYFSLFSKQISIILLGEKFRVGYKMMPFIMFTSLIYGMTIFIENKFQFSNKVMITVKGFIIASCINLILNLICIPVFNYQCAAITTLISYCILYLYYYFNDSNRYFSRLTNIKYLSENIIIVVMQVIIDLTVRRILKVNISPIYTILEGGVFLIAYFLCVKDKVICEDRKFEIHT